MPRPPEAHIVCGMKRMMMNERMMIVMAPHIDDLYAVLMADPTTTDRNGGGRTTTEVERESPDHYEEGGQENVEPRPAHDDRFDDADRRERDNDVQQGNAGRESDGRFDESVVE